MTLPIRKSVKILLINEKNELLLMCADDPMVTSSDGKYHGRFWFTVGGQIEEGENLEQAAIRELHEETGLKEEEVALGPVVWYGEFDLFLQGKLNHLHQTFLVGKTKKEEVSLSNLDEWETTAVKKLAWFSLEQIKTSKDVIYPVVLKDYLPDILLGQYPDEPIEIDLGKSPEKK